MTLAMMMRSKETIKSTCADTSYATVSLFPTMRLDDKCRRDIAILFEDRNVLSNFGGRGWGEKRRDSRYSR